MLTHYFQLLHRFWDSDSNALIILSYLIAILVAVLLGALLSWLWGGSLRRRNTSFSLLSNILESSIEYSIIALDLEGRVLAWNAGAKRNYGYEAQEMVGQNVRKLYASVDIHSGRMQAFYEEALEVGKAEGIFERVRKNGESFIALVTMTTRRNTRHQPIGYLMISKDITEQQRLEQQLQINQSLETQNREIQETNRLKNEFLANMSHELRTPLNAIIGFSELLYDQSLGSINNEQKESLADIVRSAKQLLELVSDLLDMAKMESGKMEFNPQKVNVEGLLREVLANVEMLFEKKRIHLTATVDPELGSVHLDPSRLKQVLYNLISNALKFTPEFGSVQVRVKREHSYYFRVEVEDNGIGIRPEDQKKLFKTFIQLEAGSSKKYRGSGLGLVLTKQIVEAQGGRVGVFSAFGQGSTFYVVLPRELQVPQTSRPALQTIKPVPPEVSTPQDRRATKQPPKIIIIDNDLLSLQLFQKWTKEKDYQVSYFSNPELGLESVVSQKPDVLILDLFMPMLNGFELLRRLDERKIGKAIPVVIWTALDMIPNERDKLDPSIRAVVLKGAGEATQTVVNEIEKILSEQTPLK